MCSILKYYFWVSNIIINNNNKICEQWMWRFKSYSLLNFNTLLWINIYYQWSKIKRAIQDVLLLKS